jgi:ABC-2 type transport system ATP-binding protein
MITLSNVNFAHKKHEALFNNLNLSLEAGGIYGLLGKNGAGKTSLLKLISGVIFPNAGLIQAFNCDSASREKKMLQEVYLLTEENLKYSLSGNEYHKIYAPFYPRFTDEKFTNILQEWGVQAHKKLNQLSEGERKKFFIAFALSTNCRLILLDEPSNGLDIPSKTMFRRLIAGALNEESSLVISSHQVRDLESLIDPVIILDNGKIILNQTIAKIEEKLNFGLSSTIPADEKLLYSMPSVGGIAYTSIRQNEQHYGAKIDLELLFNTVINNSAQISQIFGE